MKKFIIKIIFFIAILFFSDFIIGKGFDYLESRAQGGQAYKNYERSFLVNPDILILGSSRATHHYIPGIFQDSLGLNTYVAGQDGNGIILMYPILRFISERHKPKIVIYDIQPSFDLEKDDYTKYLRYLRLMEGKNTYADSVIYEVDTTERFKLFSKSFKNNSNILSSLKGILGSTSKFIDGYIPLDQELDSNRYNKIKNAIENNTTNDLHEKSLLKTQLLDNMVNFCHKNDIELIFVISPYYGTPFDISSFKDWSAGKNIKFINFLEKETFKIDEFADPDHLNHSGAIHFSNILVDSIKSMKNVKDISVKALK